MRRLTGKIDDDTIKQLKVYMKRNGISTRSRAEVQLIKEGLKRDQEIADVREHFRENY